MCRYLQLDEVESLARQNITNIFKFLKLWSLGPSHIGPVLLHCIYTGELYQFQTGFPEEPAGDSITDLVLLAKETYDVR